MKKSFLLFTLAAITLGLAGCDKDNSTSVSNSTSGPSSVSNSTSNSSSGTSNSASGSNTSNSNSGSTVDTDGEMQFSQVLSLLTKLHTYEVYNASSATIVNRITKNTTVTTSTEKKEVYDSTVPSSASTGTVVRTIDGKEDKNDTFVKRNAVINEKYEVNGEVNTYPMFAQIVDYENENMGGNDYKDSAKKNFIFESDEEATAEGLSKGQYVTATDLLESTSTSVAYDLASYISSYLITNVYVQQTGIDTFSYSKGSNGNISYICIVNYSVSDDEDFNDTQYHTINIQFVTDAEQTKLISTAVNYDFADMREGEEDDAYFNEVHWDATPEYGTRKDVPSDAIDVTNYFLQEITDVELYTRENNNAAVDPNNIIYSNNYNYLFARAKSYKPEKSVDISITSAGSTNSSVINFTDDGYFEIVGPGTTTLSFVYFGKDDDNIYREKTFYKDVTVVAPNPDKIRFTAIKPTIADNTLTVGQTYTFSVYVTPIKATQDIVIDSNSNPNALSVNIDKDNNVTITALASGQSTITFKVNGYESVTASMTFTVASADIDIATTITQKTYLCDLSNYGYTFSLKFNADGTGERIQHINESGKEYTDTFTYTISGNNITFGSWSNGAPKQFETGIITQDGDKITCSSESESKDYQFIANN